MIRGATVAAALLLTGCGPVPREVAEQRCFERARLAQQPRGTIGIGTGSFGTRATADITISSDYIAGRDPAALYDACVVQQSGQPPSQPLYTRADWRN